MSTINDGGPAFPNVPDGAGDRWADWDTGMTLRDYFAAKAMQSAFGSPIPSATHEKEYIAMHAYRMADAMLAARGAQ